MYEREREREKEAPRENVYVCTYVITECALIEDFIGITTFIHRREKVVLPFSFSVCERVTPVAVRSSSKCLRHFSERVSNKAFRQLETNSYLFNHFKLELLATVVHTHIRARAAPNTSFSCTVAIHMSLINAVQ
jgi:hypothetical protein